jgi:hypothetical protein
MMSEPRIFRVLVRTILAVIGDDHSNEKLFFRPSLDFALRLLEADGRDEAGRLEPLEKGENAAALLQIGNFPTRQSRCPATATTAPA